MKLRVDHEFETKIPPLTEEEFRNLEQSILAAGEMYSPIIVWNGTVVDGHNRYNILKKHPELKYSVKEMEFANRGEALNWICRNQLGRRNLTPMQKKYLIGLQYKAQKMSHGGDRRKASESNDKNNHLKQETTRQRLAKEPEVDGYSGFLLIDKKHQPKVALHIENEMRWALKRFRKLHPDIELPHITPHVFRHTFCTNMANEGMDVKNLQYLMGHSDVGVTLNIYTHSSYDHAADQLLKLVRKAPESTPVTTPITTPITTPNWRKMA